MRRETLTDPKRLKKRLRQKANMAVKYASYELELDKAPTFPDRIYVESTNVCNLECIMCPTGMHIDTRPKGYMEWDLYTSIIDEIAPWAEAVVLHSWGEPLLHKRIMDMIRYAKERDVWVETSTNAMLLTEEVAHQLLDSGLDRIYLSMDGLTKETYEKVRVKGNFERVRGNIERFLDLKQQRGSAIEADIQIVRLSETDAEVNDFVARWKESNADLINIKELDTWGGQIDQVLGLAADDQQVDTTVNDARKPCPNLWYHAHIHWDGVLVSCSRDYDAITPLGNVRNGGVLKTWHGARMQKMRNWHATGNFCAHQCLDCTEWAWWTPTPFGGGGTGGNATKVETDGSENGALELPAVNPAANGIKPLPLVGVGSSNGSGPDSHAGL